MRILCLVLLLLVIARPVWSQKTDDWESVRKNKRGTITVYWFDSNPFSYKDEKGNLAGIEFEIMRSFKKYLANEYKIDLEINWIEVNDFESVLSKIKFSKQKGVVGLAGFSITDERRKIMKLSPSFMPDIEVLVSSSDIPISTRQEDFRQTLVNSTAITVQGTLMEADLKAIRDELQVPFQIEYVTNSEEIRHTIQNKKKAFGYLSLPVYLMDLKQGDVKIRRQNFFTKLKEGHGLGFPLNSDWDTPMNSYFKTRSFELDIDAIVSRYISLDFYHFMTTLNNENEVTILNKEKEIQQREIFIQEYQLAEKTKWQNLSILVIIVFSILIILILRLFRQQLKNHRRLKEQSEEIEAQSISIKQINENLEAIVKDRTIDLEKKNRALADYTFITAHKLRAPLARILGLISFIDRDAANNEEKIILTHLDQSAKDLDVIVRSVIDNIESADKKKE